MQYSSMRFYIFEFTHWWFAWLIWSKLALWIRITSTGFQKSNILFWRLTNHYRWSYSFLLPTQPTAVKDVCVQTRCSQMYMADVGRLNQMPPKNAKLFHQGWCYLSIQNPRDWISTGETITLAGQVGPARRQHAPNHRDLRRQSTRAIRRDWLAKLNTIGEQVRRPCQWEEHFKEFPNQAAPPNTPCVRCGISILTSVNRLN